MQARNASTQGSGLENNLKLMPLKLPLTTMTSLLFLTPITLSSTFSMPPLADPMLTPLDLLSSPLPNHQRPLKRSQ